MVNSTHRFYVFKMEIDTEVTIYYLIIKHDQNTMLHSVK